MLEKTQFGRSSWARQAHASTSRVRIRSESSVFLYLWGTMLKQPVHVGKRQCNSITCIQVAFAITSLNVPSIRCCPKRRPLPRTVICRYPGNLLKTVQIRIVLVYSHCRYTLKMAGSQSPRWILPSLHSSRLNSKSSHVGEMTDLWTKKVEGLLPPTVTVIGVPIRILNANWHMHWQSVFTIHTQDGAYQ